MDSFNMLVITDHRGHSVHNSLYALVKAMSKHPLCAELDIITRGNNLNDFFFNEVSNDYIYATKVDETFQFEQDGQRYVKQLRKKYFSEYDVIWLRLPPPLSASFLTFLTQQFPDKIIINDPKGIYEAGSKAFLMNFQTVCAPMQLCTSIDDINAFRQQFPIVLKPYRDYGGNGIVRIEKDTVWMGNNVVRFDEFISTLDTHKIEYLAVKYLKNVSQGDKRIIVVNGKILGASLRLPAKDSWLCNVAMGGRSNPSEVDKQEQEIVATINPVLTQKGIVMYGVDTLVGDDGLRVLSEINTTSIGGVAQIETQSGRPVVASAIQEIVNYIQKKK